MNKTIRNFLEKKENIIIGSVIILLLIIGIMFIIRSKTFEKHAEILSNIAFSRINDLFGYSAGDLVLPF